MAHTKWKAFGGGWRISTAEGVYLGKVESEEIADRIITALDVLPLVRELDAAALEVTTGDQKAKISFDRRLQRLRAARARVASRMRGR